MVPELEVRLVARGKSLAERRSRFLELVHLADALSTRRRSTRVELDRRGAPFGLDPWPLPSSSGWRWAGLKDRWHCGGVLLPAV